MKSGQKTNLSEDIPADIQGYIEAINSDKSVQKDVSKSGQKSNSRKEGYKSGIDTREKIVDAMRNNPEVSRQELSNLLNISPSACQRHINFLKETGIIIRALCLYFCDVLKKRDKETKLHPFFLNSNLSSSLPYFLIFI